MFIQTAFDTNSGQEYVTNAKSARNYATAYGNVVQTKGLIDTLESIVDDMSDPEGGFMGSNAVGAILCKNSKST